MSPTGSKLLTRRNTLPGPDEATNQLDDEGKALAKALIEGVLLRHEARRWATHAN